MINTEKLKNALNALDAITPSRTTMPILTNLLFELQNDKLRITANDLEKSLTMVIDAQESEQFSCCVPSSELKQIVQTIREPQIEFELTDKYLVLHDGKHKTKFRYIDSDEYPLPSYTENPFRIDGDILKSSLNRTQFATSTEKHHPALTGVNVHSDGTKLFISGADGYRLSCVQMMLGIQEFNVIFSPIHRNITALLNGVIDMSVKKNQVVLSNDLFIYSTQIISGNYPDVKRLIPTTKNISIEIEKSNLRNAVKRAMVFAKNSDNVIKFSLNDNKLKIHSSDDTGENSMEIEVNSTGKDIEFAINGEFVLGFLNVCGDIAIIELTSSEKPIVFKSIGNDTFTHVIMPMHLSQ